METQKIVGTVKFEGNYAITILSYYLCGQAEASSPSEIADERFILNKGESDTPFISIGVDAKEYMEKIGNNIVLSRQNMFKLFFEGIRKGGGKIELQDIESVKNAKKNYNGNSRKIDLRHEDFVNLFHLGKPQALPGDS